MRKKELPELVIHQYTATDPAGVETVRFALVPFDLVRGVGMETPVGHMFVDKVMAQAVLRWYDVARYDLVEYVQTPAYNGDPNQLGIDDV